MLELDFYNVSDFTYKNNLYQGMNEYRSNISYAVKIVPILRIYHQIQKYIGLDLESKMFILLN